MQPRGARHLGDVHIKSSMSYRLISLNASSAQTLDCTIADLTREQPSNLRRSRMDG